MCLRSTLCCSSSEGRGEAAVPGPAAVLLLLLERECAAAVLETVAELLQSSACLEYARCMHRRRRSTADSHCESAPALRATADRADPDRVAATLTD